MIDAIRKNRKNAAPAMPPETVSAVSLPRDFITAVFHYVKSSAVMRTAYIPVRGSFMRLSQFFIKKIGRPPTVCPAAFCKRHICFVYKYFHKSRNIPDRHMRRIRQSFVLTFFICESLGCFTIIGPLVCKILLPDEKIKLFFKKISTFFLKMGPCR